MTPPFNALIVEDLEVWQTTLREVIADAGGAGWIAPSYAAALEALARHTFQLAVIDPVLDDTNRHNRDGLRVLQYILKERPAMRALVVTSSDPDLIRREVAAMSDQVPLLWKDEWDDAQFLKIIRAWLAL